MPHFECHVTLPPPTDEVERAHLEELAIQRGFKTSQIDGDPLLGAKVFFYLTCHDNDFESIKARMNEICRMVSETSRFKPLRRKIEQIVFDERTPPAPPAPLPVLHPERW